MYTCIIKYYDTIIQMLFKAELLRDSIIQYQKKMTYLGILYKN